METARNHEKVFKLSLLPVKNGITLRKKYITFISILDRMNLAKNHLMLLSLKAQSLICLVPRLQLSPIVDVNGWRDKLHAFLSTELCRLHWSGIQFLAYIYINY